ncbi:unnamed protein product [Symbiodinium natans]|uniref:Uncharacterized protein n=1 Tax=Symbiodinium natans TaxID=878477 RepID=A0A812IJF0_9DINO|nr:unnamed protein product [Symbiodinium natans]
MAPGNKQKQAASTGDGSLAKAEEGSKGSKGNAGANAGGDAGGEPGDTLAQLMRQLGQCRMQEYKLENQVLQESHRRVTELQGRLRSTESRLSAAESKVAELEKELASARSSTQSQNQNNFEGAYDAKKPPCFRTANQDIKGNMEIGYLSVQNGALVVATHLQEDYYFGYQFDQPSNQGWFPVAQTRDFDRREFGQK